MYNAFDVVGIFVVGLYFLLFANYVSQKALLSSHKSWKILRKKSTVQILGILGILLGLIRFYVNYLS